MFLGLQGLNIQCMVGTLLGTCDEQNSESSYYDDPVQTPSTTSAELGRSPTPTFLMAPDRSKLLITFSQYIL